MAIKFSELNKKFHDDKLSDKEQQIMNTHEKKIDEILSSSFKDTGISVHWNLIEFANYGDINSIRKKVMKNHIMKLYQDAGWKIKHYETNDDSSYVFSEGKEKEPFVENYNHPSDDYIK